MNAIIEMGLAELQNFVVSPSGQDVITAFVDGLRTELGSREKWLKACESTDVSTFNSRGLYKLLSRFEEFIGALPPGHDIGHFYRDALAGMALMSDPFVQKGFKSDAIAGLLGGMFHDLGNSVTHRYEDRKRKCGHAEIGSWIFFIFSKGLLNENLRKMTAYSIAAHTHYPRPLAVEEPKGYERQPYPYGLWFMDDGKPYGLAPILTRFCDRLDLGGGVTHLCRHFNAEMDALESGGEDFDGEKFLLKNWKSFSKLFIPRIRTKKGKLPTILEWMKIFVESGFGNSVYSEYDTKFIVMFELMLQHKFEFRQMVRIANNSSSDSFRYFETYSVDLIYETLSKVSGSHRFDRSWENFVFIFEEIDIEYQIKWTSVFEYVSEEYVQWVKSLLEHARKSDFSPVAERMAKRLLSGFQNKL